MSPRTRVFISYSHKDREWLDRLLVHLRPLERENKVDIWVDTKIRPGEKWQAEILAAVDAARVAVLLISANFLASDFIVKAELPALLKAAEHEGARIFPLLLSPSRFARTEGLKDLQTANGSLVSLISLPRAQQEEILDGLAAEIEKLISEEQLPNPPIPTFPPPMSLSRADISEVAPSSVPAQTFNVIADRKQSSRHVFVHTCLTAEGFFDDGLGSIAPYDELFGPLDAPHLTSEIHMFMHLPEEEALTSASTTEFSAITAICCSDPKRIASFYSRAIRRLPTETPVRFFERQEQVMAVAADALESAFVVAVAVPPTFIRAGHKRPEVYYQAMCGIFLVPLIDLHKRLHVKTLHILVPGIGKCTKRLLDISKRSVGSVYPEGNWSVQTLPEEVCALGEIAENIAWAVKRLYNRKDSRWISYFQRTT